MYLINTPFFLRWYYTGVTWNRSRKEKKLYLTFDDGPIPEITPWILDILSSYNIKATFFCVGENIVKHPSIFERLISDGHRIGNHTYNHLKGWETTDQDYFDNIQKCNSLTKSNLFRPPYARAKKSQINKLKKNYELIYWDVLSGDFDINLTPEKCLKNVIDYTKNGSIIVFHDNIKAIPGVKYTLPRFIEFALEQGFTFDRL